MGRIRETLLFVAVGVIAGLAFEAAENAKEAHRHTHEIACELGISHHCEFVK